MPSMSASISLLRTLVGFDTTSHRSNMDLVDWAVAAIEPFGARIRLSYDDTRTKANLLASFGPAVPGGVVLSGHSDVVPVEGQYWSSDPFVLTESGGRLHGRGTADMKAFVACCLAAVPGMTAARLQRPIHIALSYDEEVGCFGVSRLIADLLAHEAKPALAIIGEPTQMRIGDRHRGFLGFRTRFTGKPAHSSDPSAGASAIYPACAFVAFLEALNNDAGAAGIDATTFNVGRIHGGIAINIVPEACDVVWEFRPSPGADVAAIRATIDSFLTRATPSDIAQATQLLTRVPPLAPDPHGLATAFAVSLGASRPAFAMPFGTEAGFFQEVGIPAVICGPGSIAQAHQPDEWIEIDQIVAADRFLAGVTRWAASELQPPDPTASPEG
jgi:acetylornithine deacetylase